MMRSLLLALLFVSTAVHAENGLQRFEREMRPQLQLEKFTYSGGEALGDDGFVLKDVVAVIPATPETDNKRSTVKIDKVTVDKIDFERFKASNKDDLPRFVKMKLEGITGDEAASKSLAEYGLPKAPADLVLDYRLDTAAKRLMLDKLELSLRGLGRVELALVIDGVSDKADEVEDTKDSGRLLSASLTIDDKGLLAQMLTVGAKSQGSKPEELIALGQLTLSSFAGPQDAESMKAFDAVASFMADWRAPKGPITITVRPAKGASFADFGGLLMPNALREVLGLSVVYAGTRPGAASPK